MGLLLLALGAFSLLFGRSAGPLAGVGPTIMGLVLVTKGLRGSARQHTPTAQSRVGDAAALSIWRAPWLSFYSHRFYDDVGRRGRGVGLQYLLVQALLYATIGLGFASLFRKSLSYGASLRLSIAAVTPVILVHTILGLTGATPASGFLWWSLCLAAALGFLAFGVKSLADDEAIRSTRH